MIIVDRLSTELDINYMDLFNKANKYNSIENKKIREDIRVHKIFKEKEVDFLACYALEFLKENGINDGQEMNNINVEKLRIAALKIDRGY